MSEVSAKWFFFPEGFLLYNLKHLELQTGYTQYDLLGMAALLKFTPNFKSMIFNYLSEIDKDASTLALPFFFSF